MLKNYKVEAYNKLPSTKVDGITLQGALERSGTVYCDMQPYSKALLIKQYGYDIEVTKQFFMDTNSNVKIGTILHYTNPRNIIEKYEVRAIPWDADGYIVVVCNGV